MMFPFWNSIPAPSLLSFPQGLKTCFFFSHQILGISWVTFPPELSSVKMVYNTPYTREAFFLMYPHKVIIELSSLRNLISKFYSVLNKNLISSKNCMFPNCKILITIY